MGTERSGPALRCVCRWQRTVKRNGTEGISFAEPQRPVAGLAKPRRIRENSLEYGLEVPWRTADNAEDLEARLLPLQRFAQLAAARFEFPLVAAPPASQQANKAVSHSGTSPWTNRRRPALG